MAADPGGGFVSSGRVSSGPSFKSGGSSKSSGGNFNRSIVVRSGNVRVNSGVVRQYAGVRHGRHFRRGPGFAIVGAPYVETYGYDERLVPQRVRHELWLAHRAGGRLRIRQLTQVWTSRTRRAQAPGGFVEC